MKPEYVLTPSNKLDAKTVLSEANVDIRRELIRKIGMERFMAVCPHKTMDKVGDYELLSISLSDEIKDARFLKMLNPSIGCWHLEGVDPACATVQQSINWRSGQTENWKPELLT